LVRSPRVLAGNRLCIVVHPRARGRVADLFDLLSSDLRLIIPQSATDPCGQYVVELFAEARLSEAMALKEQEGTLLHSIGSGDLPNFLFDGRADCGIFYASEAKALGDRVETVWLPEEIDGRDRIVFVIGLVTRDEPAHPDAERFVEFMLGDGQRILRDHGFLPPIPAAERLLPWLT
jgi:ABC-type molybdate transport system substrate-binding protein